MAQAATVIRKAGKASTTKGKGKGKAEPKVCGTRAIPEGPTYTTSLDEFKGYPIIQFWSEGNDSRWADLQVGSLKKCKALLAIAADPHLVDSIKDFVEQHYPEKEA